MFRIQINQLVEILKAYLHELRFLFAFFFKHVYHLLHQALDDFSLLHLDLLLQGLLLQFFIKNIRVIWAVLSLNILMFD